MDLHFDEWFSTANAETLGSSVAPVATGRDCSFLCPLTFGAGFDYFPSLQIPYQKNSQVPFLVFQFEEHSPIQSPVTRVDH